MSEPWPPAFIRSAPPTDPGTPTPHSRPCSPAAADLRATTGSLAPAPARTDDAVDLDPVEPRAQPDDEPGEAGVGHEEVRALPQHEQRHRRARGHERAVHGHEVVLGVRLDEQPGVAPDAVGGARPERRVARARWPERVGDGVERRAGARSAAGAGRRSPRRRRLQLVGERREVAGPEGQTQVSRARAGPPRGRAARRARARR